MTEPAEGSWLDPNVQFDSNYMTTTPATRVELTFTSETSEEYILTTLGELAEQQKVMAQQLQWLCFHVSNILQMASSNPMMKMMMRKAGNNG